MTKIEREAQKAQALQLFLAGYSQKEISRKLGVTENSLATWKHKYKWNEKVGGGDELKAALLQIGVAVQAQQARYRQQAQKNMDKVRQYAAQAQHELTQQQRLHESFYLLCAKLGYGDLTELEDSLLIDLGELPTSE